MLKIGLPKGVVKGRSYELIEKFNGTPVNKKRLYFKIENVEFFLLKHRDIPLLVESGILDYGITSTEWIVERLSDLNILADLDWCTTKISLISPKGKPVIGSKINKICVTEFINITQNFIDDNLLKNFKIVPISGSSESLVGTIYDCSVDCVESGSTLLANDLYEEVIIMNSVTSLVSNKNLKIKDSKIIEIIKEI